MNPKISVIIPIYNADKYISRAISSVLKNTYKNLQLICVDDGSIDNSFLECKKFMETDSRIEVYQKENGGEGSARNYALNFVKGDWISFLDADDWILPTMYEEIISELIKADDSRINMVRLRCNKISIRDISDEEIEQKIKNFPIPEVISRDQLIQTKQHGGFMHSLFIKSNLVFDNSILFNENVYLLPDKIFTFQCLMYTDKVLVYLKQNYQYFNNPNGALNSSKSKRLFKFNNFIKVNKAYSEMGSLKHLPLLNNLRKKTYAFHISEMFKICMKTARLYLLPKILNECLKYRVIPNG
jgi:glycosyltransferase involved in cell wall biosynthesis